MPVRLVHLVDESAGEDELRLLALLLQRLPRERVRQHVLVMGRLPASLDVPTDVATTHTRRPPRVLILAALAQHPSRELRRLGPDMVYGWGGVGLGTGVLQRVRSPVVAVLGDPGIVRNAVRWFLAGYPSLAERQMAFVCLTGTIQRRLVDGGVAAGATVVVRPAVDLGAICRAGQTQRRSDMGLPADGRVLLTPSPPSRPGGQYHAIWAAAILYQIWPDLRLVIPGTSREQARLRRFASQIYCPQIYHFTSDRYTPAQLLAVCNLLVVPALGDIPTGWLAWAMAAGVPIVASAVPAVTELIADGQNGVLCGPGEPHTLAIRIRSALQAEDTLTRQVDLARVQAFETFHTQQCVDRHLAVIENVRAGRPPGTGLMPDAGRA